MMKPDNTKKLIAGISGLLLLALILILWLRPEHHPVPPEMTTSEKKERFIELMLPVIENIDAELQREFARTSDKVDKGEDLSALREEYKAETDQQLLEALKPHPVSITLAQAALESAWATSRFFVEGNNVFGVWSFDADEPRIAAGSKRGDKTVYVKKYRSLKAAVRDYYRTLARGDKYSRFRQLRLQSSDPYLLVTGLDSYSEKGSAYGGDLANVIRHNQFEQFD